MRRPLTRRDFVADGIAAGMLLAWGGCQTASTAVAPKRCLPLMRRYVDEELFGGIAVASNRGDFAAAGMRTLSPDGGPMTADCLFDLASVAKTQTAALCALLASEGRLDVDAPFTEYLTEHVLAKENCQITVRDLATHSGGFDNSKPYMTPDLEKQFAALYAKRPVRPRGEGYEYACSNFVYLGLIVEKLTRTDLDTAAKRLLWGPLGMTHTTWNPIVGNPLAVEYSPSTYAGQGPHRRIGDHNDCGAYYAPRPVGNGSAFSSVGDMLKFVMDLLHRERFTSAYYDLLFTPCYSGCGHRRSFGFEMRSEISALTSWTPTSFSDEAICHTGWTGSAIVIDPARDFAGVVLASQKAGKAKTMGPRMHLLDVMSSESDQTVG